MAATASSATVERKAEGQTLAVRAVPFTQVRFQDSFWQPRLATNRRATLAAVYAQLEATGRLAAFDWAPNNPATPHQPHIFWDSDVAKWIEAAGYVLAEGRDAALEAQVDGYVAALIRAQAADGYANSYFLRVEPAKRWTNLRDNHELYCAGHLIEAAVAYHAATGKRALLDAMCRYADHIATVFGPGAGQKRGVPGHEEIELALVKLAGATGEKKYLRLAQYFVDARGQEPDYFAGEAARAADGPARPGLHRRREYAQNHLPVREQREIVGHAVRALYLYAGMADTAAATGDGQLLTACRALFDNVAARRMFVTGGVGPTHLNEGMTCDYDLPEESAYAETCAAIALALFAHRMLQAEPEGPDGRYADVLERALYNGILSGVALNGTEFFYGNPLGSTPGFDGNGNWQGVGYCYRRQAWFGCSCCPTNIVRFLPSLPGYVYSQNESAVWVHLYVGGAARMELAGGAVRLTQATAYPWDGAVRITVGVDVPQRFGLNLRLPSWCRTEAVTLTVNGAAVAFAGAVRRGYVTIAREWQDGDVVQLTLPLPVERVRAHPAARQLAGKVALQRGPVVYCVESCDMAAGAADLAALRLPTAAALTAKKETALLGGVAVIEGTAAVAAGGAALYSPAAESTRPVAFRAVPYAVWGNRAPGAMRVWLPETAAD